MDSFDLDLDNYTLDDLLALFKLDYDFNKEELGRAYRMALKTHPDKCNLEQDIYLFFMKAYKMIERVYKFRVGRNERNTEYILEQDKNVLIEKINGMKVIDFNKWFNKMFNKYQVKNDSDEGYGDWYKDTEEKAINKVSKTEFNDIFRKKKSESRALVKVNEVIGCMGSNGYDLETVRPESFTSGLFSKLQYEDLKKAHTETVIPVTEEDYLSREKFNSVGSYKRHRSSEFMKATTPDSLKQASEYLRKKKQANDEYDSRRAFNILKRDEEIEKKNKEWWSELNLLKN